MFAAGARQVFVLADVLHGLFSSVRVSVDLTSQADPPHEQNYALVDVMSIARSALRNAFVR